ncbi:hypothetical protein [Alicycliphilus denitrificans]|uniref:hypothetical protein n=1 Tax=Alicycliphilus denitrificans TaxID=179636 RepID=UPI0038506D0F
MSQAESLARDKVASADWSLADWNAALIRQIFMRPERASTSLSRVDTTGRLLRKVAGEADGEVAKRRFIAAFGDDPARIKSQYIWSQSIPAITQRDGIPPTFAALYLTLLAASADDSTFEDGNFRNRFSKLLGCPDLATFGFGELPRLWLHFAEWTRSRQRSKRDCARLLLPDPHHEKLIGQSKRLAFPTYRDELQLRATLKKSGLDSDASFASVSSVVHARLTAFSSNFREELTTFHQFVARGRQLEAYESPFWGAIRDIRQESEEERAEAYGRFCILLDASDPRNLEYCLLSDSRGLRSMAEGERIVLDRPQGSYCLMWRDPAGTLAIDAIAARAAQHRDLARSRVGTALLAGCVVFFPNSVGRLTTDGEYYDNGPVALVSRLEYSDRLTATCRELGVRWLGASAHDANGEWRTMVFPSIGRASLDRLSALLPQVAKGLARSSWRPPRPRLSGGAWFGQALLLNPASNPVVHMEDCEAGRFALIDETGREISAGALVVMGDGLCIPPAMLVDARQIAACRYVLELGADRESVLEVPVVTEIPSLDCRQVGDRGAWLSDGPNGSLSSLELLRPLPRTVVDLARQRPLTGAWPLLEPTSTASIAPCAPVKQSQPQQPFGWLTEVLALRYARRTSLPFSELRSHLDMVAAATDISPWVVRRLLLAGCWLRSVERRTSPFPTLTLADRMISCRSVNGRSVARISGMFQEAELRDLKQALHPTESISRIGSDELQAVIGCLEVSFDSMHRAREMANRHDLIWIEQEAPWNPMAGMLLPTSEIGFREVMRPNLLLEEWDCKARLWLEARAVTEEPALGALFKAQGNQRNTFWIKSKDGFFATDSSSWAWLVHTLEIEGSLGRLSVNGDVSWSERIMSLPSTLCRWWLHLGGGCVGIDSQGALVFIGGSAKSIWEGVAIRTPDHPAILAEAYRCFERRALALRIRRRRPS